MRTTKGVDDALRLKIIEEHLSGSSKSSLAKKYNLRSGPSGINRWMCTFGIAETEDHAVPEGFVKKKKDANKSSEVLSLELENRKLKAGLAYERMRADAFDTMIDLAEETYQIQVRKNSATRQS
ncbi:MAG: hypothetical protein LBQ73_03955 [Tannerellaceae bacterium]|jgi:hypothetical protein|nr:hypothetical protein [Tannerellaceae bacterium]